MPYTENPGPDSYLDYSLFEYQFQLMKSGVPPSESERFTIRELKKWFQREEKYRQQQKEQMS